MTLLLVSDKPRVKASVDLQKRRKNEIGGNLLILDAIAYLSRLVCEIPEVSGLRHR